ncbi:MAG TPA: hypothetical protein VK202_08915 [Bacteroidia bacterium]|nr:hypothetical protein [Bacteroidia bacterium]
MAITIEKSKQLAKTLLKFSVHKTISKNFDWKVTRSISTEEPLSEADIKYRAGRVALYNKRIQALDVAETLEEVNNISLKF